MSTGREPLFLERRGYRVRRLGDAARLMPSFGLLLFLVPLLWASEAATSRAMLFVFGVWAFLILCAFVIARALATARVTDD